MYEVRAFFTGFYYELSFLHSVGRTVYGWYALVSERKGGGGGGGGMVMSDLMLGKGCWKRGWGVG